MTSRSRWEPVIAIDTLRLAGPSVFHAAQVADPATRPHLPRPGPWASSSAAGYGGTGRPEAIFADDGGLRRFLATLGEAAEKTGWQAPAYCLMTNHFHLVVETPRPTWWWG